MSQYSVNLYALSGLANFMMLLKQDLNYNSCPEIIDFHKVGHMESSYKRNFVIIQCE